MPVGGVGRSWEGRQLHGKHLGPVCPRINTPLPHSWNRLFPCRHLYRFCCVCWWILVVCFGSFQHPALSHSCTHISLTLLITVYTQHCIFSFVALVNIYIFCYSLSPRCLPLLRALSRFVTGPLKAQRASWRTRNTPGRSEILLWRSLKPDLDTKRFPKL